MSLARRPSSRAGYQSKWLVFRQWCRSEGHSISRPSLPKIADFLFWLRRSRRLSVSSVMGYRSMLSAVFKSVLPEISTSPVLHVLLRSFQAEAPIREVRPPSWDLNVVLFFLRSSSFEPLTTISLRDLTRKTLFLLSLATAKRVGEIQALSRRVSLSLSLTLGAVMVALVDVSGLSIYCYQCPYTSGVAHCSYHVRYIHTNRRLPPSIISG